LKTILLILLNVILLTSGQLLWKKGLTAVGGISLSNIMQVLMSPFIVGGLLLYAVATIVWFAVLSEADLSFAYPLQSMAYIIGMLAAWLILKEVIPMTRWVGVLIIMIGVAVVSYK
jgi:drug/metabolite transporter (DMT)-like permease